MFSKRVSLFMGHYGSGKTFVAVNYAIALKSLGKDVSIYDLDIVNPYFRTVDAQKLLIESGVELIVSPFAETNVDLPAINSASYKMITDKNRFAVCDIGGDDRGALALGRFSKQILEENNYDVLWVVNNLRPETRTVEDALEIKREIEVSSRMNFTGIINNANLGNETDERIILNGYEFCLNLSKQTGLPIKFTSIRSDLINENLKKNIKDILPIQPIKYGDWL